MLPYILIQYRTRDGGYQRFYGPCKNARPLSAPRYADEYIEHWAKVFLAEQLIELGIVFESFLIAPAEILAAVLAERERLRDVFRPLLPRQECVRQQLAFNNGEG